MKIFLVTLKFLKELVREPWLGGLLVALPVAFLLIFVASFHSPTDKTIPVLVLNNGKNSTAFFEELKSGHYSNGNAFFEPKLIDDIHQAIELIKKKEAAMMVTVQSDSVPLDITVTGDAVDNNFLVGGTLMIRVLRKYVDQTVGRAQLLMLDEQSITHVIPKTEFDIYAPGMIVFALMLLIPHTGMILAREVRLKTLNRLKLARIKLSSFLIGVSLSQLVLALLQASCLFGVCKLLGFFPEGSLLSAWLISLCLGLSAIGWGLIVACFSTNDNQALNIGSVFCMLQVFLSGSFFPMPATTFFTLGHHEIGFYDIFPATHAMLALQQTLSLGVPLEQVSFRLVATFILSLFWGGVGIVLFGWMKRGKA